MMDKYEEFSTAFFDELAKGIHGDLRNLFLTMLRELVIASAVAYGNHPGAGLDEWTGGRISICNELTNRVDEALRRASEKANLATTDRFFETPI